MCARFKRDDKLGGEHMAIQATLTSHSLHKLSRLFFMCVTINKRT